MESELILAYFNGKYYNPANSHYNKSGIINCDRCHKTNIKICIGYNKIDLCMKCVEVLNDIALLPTSVQTSDQNKENSSASATSSVSSAYYPPSEPFEPPETYINIPLISLPLELSNDFT